MFGYSVCKWCIYLHAYYGSFTFMQTFTNLFIHTGKGESPAISLTFNESCKMSGNKPANTISQSLSCCTNKHMLLHIFWEKVFLNSSTTSCFELKKQMISHYMAITNLLEEIPYRTVLSIWILFLKKHKAPSQETMLIPPYVWVTFLWLVAILRSHNLLLVITGSMKTVVSKTCQQNIITFWKEFLFVKKWMLCWKVLLRLA